MSARLSHVPQETSTTQQEWLVLVVKQSLSLTLHGVMGQAVRDEILNIMHRNNIGEKRGTWMEDWHQKLHNNTTPDDVAICEAYIAFLEAQGDNGVYWRVLSDAGLVPSLSPLPPRPCRRFGQYERLYTCVCACLSVV